jgi:hypothetical protein
MPEFWPDDFAMISSGGISSVEVDMSDKPREWPNLAREARDRAAEEAAEALRALEPLINRVNDLEDLRRVGIAVKKVTNVLRLLESVGAPTRP